MNKYKENQIDKERIYIYNGNNYEKGTNLCEGAGTKMIQLYIKI